MSAPVAGPDVEAFVRRLREVSEALGEPSRVANAAKLVDSLSIEAQGDFGGPALIGSLERLVHLIELRECLGSEESAADALATFLTDALDRLSRGLESGKEAEASAWILSESTERWGEYLGLIEPGEDLNASAALGDEPPTLDDAPAIDTNTLLRLLGGAAVSEPEEKLTPPAMAPPAPRKVVAPPPATVAQSTSSPAIPELDPELREVFVADALDLSERIQNLIVDLTQEGDRAEALRELCRCLHTLKGAAGSVGLTELARGLHRLEDDLEAADDLDSCVLVERVDQVFRELEQTIAALRQQGARSAVNRPGTLHSPDEPAESPPIDTSDSDRDSGSTAIEAPIRVPEARLDELMDLSAELLARRDFWTTQAEALKQCVMSARGCAQRLMATVDRLGQLGPEQRPRSGSRPDLAEIMRVLSEQAEDLNVLAEATRTVAVPLADEGETFGRLSLQVWESLQAIRIVPVRGLFQRLARVARDAARVEGRQIEVIASGEAHGLDRSVQERAFEPMLHIVRNAVGHGIEPPEQRVRAGKPPAGRVKLEARRDGNALVLIVQDDGCGLDYAAIAAKGRALGLLGADEKLTTARLNALIFHSGFSTRSQANAISGRGVGMDIIAKEVARLRGTLELASQPGAGTTLSIRLPARLALERSMVIRVADQAFGIPMNSVESVESASSRGSGNTSQEPRSLDVRTLLGFPARPVAVPYQRLNVRTGTESVPVDIDRIEGVFELIVKPLGSLLAGNPAIAGTSLTMAGEVILLLNPAGLVEMAGARGGSPSREPAAQDERAHPVLVVDDSLSVRRVAARNLRVLGIEVDEAANGLEALGKVRARPYSVIVTDLDMPRMDGFELLAELTRLGIARTTPLVVCSTRSDAETRRRVLGAGARLFLPKPVDASMLEAALAPLLL